MQASQSSNILPSPKYPQKSIAQTKKQQPAQFNLKVWLANCYMH